MLQVTQFPARVVYQDKEKYLYFGGTDYLGLSTQPDFIKLLAKNTARWGVNYGSSRLSNVRLSVYQEAEAAWSEWLGCEATLTVSSGTLAAQLALKSFETDTDFYHLPDTHPAAIHPGSKLWKKRNLPLKNAVLTADTFPGLTVKPTNFQEIVPALNREISVLVDDSHGLGISGNSGKGQWSSLRNLPVKEVVLVGSLAKALCLPGGLIDGSRQRIEKIKILPEFVTASGMPPAYLQSFLDGASLYKKQFEKLQQNLKVFSKLMENDFSGFVFSPDYPVLYSSHLHLGKFLRENHILITNFDYPQPGNTLNRIVLTAHHRRSDLQAVAVALKKFVNT